MGKYTPPRSKLICSGCWCLPWSQQLRQAVSECREPYVYPSGNYCCRNTCDSESKEKSQVWAENTQVRLLRFFTAGGSTLNLIIDSSVASTSRAAPVVTAPSSPTPM